PGFHARRSAVSKLYRYELDTGPLQLPTRRLCAGHVPFALDAGRVQEAARLYLGRQDFASLASAGGSVVTTVRTVTRSDARLAGVPSGSEEQSLARAIDWSRLPRHVAIIMDGNGRWAKLRHKQRVEGHRAGIDSVRDVVETSARLGLQVLTLYAFSVENWKRPQTEVSTLMELLKRYLRMELQTLLRNNIRFQVIGRMGELPPDVQEELQRGIERTRERTG